jgi:hypothetical protein
MVAVSARLRPQEADFVGANFAFGDSNSIE